MQGAAAEEAPGLFLGFPGALGPKRWQDLGVWRNLGLVSFLKHLQSCGVRFPWATGDGGDMREQTEAKSVIPRQSGAALCTPGARANTEIQPGSAQD